MHYIYHIQDLTYFQMKLICRYLKYVYFADAESTMEENAPIKTSPCYLNITNSTQFPVHNYWVFYPNIYE